MLDPGALAKYGDKQGAGYDGHTQQCQRHKPAAPGATGFKAAPLSLRYRVRGAGWLAGLGAPVVDGMAVRFLRGWTVEFRAVVVQFSHRRRKAITAPWNRQNVLRLIGVLVQGFSQGGDVPDEVVLLYHRIGPDLLQELIFLDHLPTVLKQIKQQLEGLQADRHDLSFPQQNGLLRVHEEWAELVKSALAFAPCRFHNFSGIFQRRRRDFSRNCE